MDLNTTQQHIKSIHPSSTKRIRYVSTKAQSKFASADVYRKRKSHDEARVHHHANKKLKSSDDSSFDFSTELEVAGEKNSSEIFREYYQQAWPLCRSLPELLHHANQLVTLTLSYLLTENQINLATKDMLHLLTCLFKTFRHEIHPHSRNILSKLVDVITVPLLNVPMLQSAFRCLGYLLKYDLQIDIELLQKQYFGIVLGHNREIVRKLGAECFAPLLNRSKEKKKKCVKKILKGLSLACKNVEGSSELRSVQKKKRLAMEGVSMLLFHAAKGVPGQLHSKGAKDVLGMVLEYLVEEKLEEERREVVCEVVKMLLESICRFVKREYFEEVWIELEKALRGVIEGAEEEESITTMNQKKQCALKKIVEAIGVCVLFKKGCHAQQRAENLSSYLSKLLDHSFFDDLEPSVQTSVINLFCFSWKVNPNHEAFSSVLATFLSQKQDKVQSIDSSLLLQLARNLPSSLPNTTQLTPLLLSTASYISKEKPEDALILLHSITTASSNTDTDQIFHVEPTKRYTLSQSDHNVLLKLCSIDLENEFNISKLCYAIRCIPFLACNCSTVTSKTIKSILKWYHSTFSTLNSQSSSQPNNNIMIAKSMILQALSITGMHHLSHSHTKKIILKVKPHAESLLLQNPTSICTLQALRAFFRLLTSLDVELTSSPDQILETLVPNLQHQSHVIRKYTLELLTILPPKQYIINHADLDLTDDLDEEPSPTTPSSTTTPSSSSTKTTNIRKGSCNLLQTLLDVENLEISLDNERKFTSHFNQVELSGRNGQLPIQYADAASHFCLGALNIKFSPVWEVAIETMQSLVENHERSVWDALLKKLKEVMRVEKIGAEGSEETEKKNEGELEQHWQSCIKWEESNGMDASLLGNEVAIRFSTDHTTLFESAWSILEGLPQLATKKSRDIVPMFLQFLHGQYYVYHKTNPDQRELSLSDYIDVDQTSIYPTDRRPNKKDIMTKLRTFFKIFSKITGPKTLHKHHLLQQIYICFLSDPDWNIATLSFQCLMTYKLPYIVPYQDTLKNLLSKFKFRDTMVKFDISSTGDDIDKRHRNDLIPILSRMLYGRLSSPTGRSKDNAYARRAAIVGFLAGLDKGELDWFAYMMVRMFIPLGVSMKMDAREEVDVGRLIDSVEVLEKRDLERIGVGGVMGFLNLVEVFVVKLGCDGVDYVPVIMKLLVGISHYAVGHQGQKPDQEQKKKERDNENEENEDNVNNKFEYEKEEEEEKDEEEGKEKDDDISPSDEAPSLQLESHTSRFRTSCFRRLSQIFRQYAPMFDFSPYTPKLWSILTPSIEALPNTAVYTNHPPSLLSLFETLSSHPQLLPLLKQNDEAIKAVFLCIDAPTRDSIMNSVLAFVDNLLTECGTSDSFDGIGARLVERHIHLLVSQFTKRFRNCRNDHLDKRELSILCETAHLLQTNPILETETLETLSALLLPHLVQSSSAENTQLDILSILWNIVPKLSAEGKLSHLVPLSKLLGPDRINPGIKVFRVRNLVIDVIEEISDEMKPIAKFLKELNAVDEKHVEEFDFDRILPAWNDLAQERTWEDLACGGDAKLLNPLMYQCLHSLHDPDGIVQRGSFLALKTFVSAAAKRARLDLGEEITTERAYYDPWVRIINTTLSSCVKIGMNNTNDSIRKQFTFLLVHICTSFEGFPCPHLYAELSILIRNDDPNLDFFLNITHVQIHRRSRALNRLRKALDSHEFLQQSLWNVLLPLSTHPVYDCRSSSSEEAYALEAIATVGAIARKLNWGHYKTALDRALATFKKHPDRERLIVGMICSILDAFHFEVVAERDDEMEEDTKKEDTKEEDTKEIDDGTKNDDDNEKPNQPKNENAGNSILRILNNRLIPQIESLLTKETTKRDRKVVSIRSPVVLALAKLFRKFPRSQFESKLPRLILTVCEVLRSWESDARDAARATLAKVAIELDVAYLSEILKALASMLKEGNHLHVRAATLHSIVMALSKAYRRPSAESNDDSPEFDKCVPAMMDLIRQDLFGMASEMKAAESSKKRHIKEAGGVKSYETLEIICKMILVKPTMMASSNGSSQSTLHVVIGPLLERLRLPDVDNVTIGKIRECLNRVVIGISHNDSTEAREIMPFVYATVAPFLNEGRPDEHDRDGDDDEDGTDSDEDDPEATTSIVVSGKARSKEHQKRNKTKIVEWRPSTLNAPKDNKEALEMKNKQKAQLRKVQDGANAPKLTGKARYGSLKTTAAKRLDDPATVSGVLFGLSLLRSCLKRSKLDKTNDKIRSMADPFVPMLTTCIRSCSSNEVILLALKCLGFLLKWDLPSVPKYAKVLGKHVLGLLTTSGATRNEMTQSCFKTLTLLMALDQKSDSVGKTTLETDTSTPAEEGEIENQHLALPLNAKQMEALVSLLHGALTDTEHYNPTFGLLKAIVSKRYISAEFYDMMETVLKLSVQSQKSTVRQQNCQIFMRFLIDYPLGKKRLEDHLKQIVLNIQYEYEDGRTSAIGLLLTVIQNLPIPLLTEHAQLFFLPLVLQLVNDDSKKCRQTVADCIKWIFKRVSGDRLLSFFDYISRWFGNDDGGTQGRSLKRTAAQLYGILVDARPDFASGSTATDLLTALRDPLQREVTNVAETRSSSNDNNNEWELSYFCLVCIEKLHKNRSDLVSKQHETWIAILKCLVHPHPWIRQISSRIVGARLSSSDPASSLLEEEEASPTFLTIVPGSVYEIARNVCFQLNVRDDELNDEIVTQAVKILSWVVKAMHHHPHLCFETSNTEDDSGTESNPESDESDDDDHDNTPTAKSKDPIAWLITRLSHIAKNKGDNRRTAVYKCFAAIVASCDPTIMTPYLELLMEPLHRSIVEFEIINETKPFKHPRLRSAVTAADYAGDLMQLIEDTYGSKRFLEAYVVVKAKARDKREKRKKEIAAEAVRDPMASAARKMKKQEMENRRKKRRVDEWRVSRGGVVVAGKKKSRFVD